MLSKDYGRNIARSKLERQHTIDLKEGLCLIIHTVQSPTTTSFVSFLSYIHTKMTTSFFHAMPILILALIHVLMIKKIYLVYTTEQNKWQVCYNGGGKDFIHSSFPFLSIYFVG